MVEALWRVPALWRIGLLSLLLQAGAVGCLDVPKPAADMARLTPREDQACALQRSHSHNDFEHKRPLLDALARGFSSVEADVWLNNGELAVAHNFWNARAERTLETLYLGPLLARVQAHSGVVYAGSRAGGFQLLIDVKTDAEETYSVLERALARYSSILTKFSADGVRVGAVTAIISGNCPRALIAAEHERYAACDGSMHDLHRGPPVSLVPLISSRWGSLFDWEGKGPMPLAERAQLLTIVRDAHANGRRIRFWSTPDEPATRTAVWTELIAAGVDYINTDALEALRSFLLVHGS